MSITECPHLLLSREFGKQCGPCFKQFYEYLSIPSGLIFSQITESLERFKTVIFRGLLSQLLCQNIIKNIEENVKQISTRNGKSKYLTPDKI